MDYTIILLILILVVLITSFGFFIYRLINKLDKYENIIMEQDQILTGLREAVRYSSEKLKEHDTKGHYSSDDDLGNYFRTLLEVDKVITEYIGLISNEETESRE
jgi:hypothetical protein